MGRAEAAGGGAGRTPPTTRARADRADGAAAGRTGAMGELLVGTASWTDKSLLQSGWYPPGASSAEERLRYYASQFPLFEVDSSYYFLPRKNMAEVWVERTPPHFTFNIKAFSLLTQHPTKVEAVPKELLGSVEKKQLYLTDFEPKAVDAVWDMFLDALVPLADAGKLGALLF